MKQSYLLLTLLLLIVPGYTFAQTNSVTLKDGNNVVLTNHASINAAYAAIPATLTQSYIIEINATYTGSAEIFPINFFPKAGASAANTITLRPASGVSAVTVSNTSTGANLFQLNDADYVIVDGRPGGTGTQRALTFWNMGTTSSSNTIALINGASNNILRYLIVNNSSTGSAGRSIFFGTSTGATGNSNNLVEHVNVIGGRYSINSNGTVANPNVNNKFYGCDVDNVIFAGMWFQSGTGKVYVDSCTIHCTTPAGTGPYGILFDSQSDTARITRNLIFGLQNNGTSTAAIQGVSVRSNAAGINVVRLINNMISLSANSTSVYAIEFAGSGLVQAQLYFNTIRLAGSIGTIGTSGNVGSSGIFKSNSNTGSTFDFRNNIIVNERSGGNNLQHLAVYLSSTNGTINADYNTYFSTTGNLVRVLTTVYNSMSAYQAAFAPLDANSNSTAVQFASANDLHLAGTSIGDAALNGTPIALVTNDIDNDPRAIPVKGADEISITGCSAAAGPGATIVSDDEICAGDAVTLSSGFNSAYAGYYTFQWQQSTNGTTFTNLATATSQTHIVSPSADTYYRLVITCIATASSDTATAALVEVDNPIPAFSVNETHTDLTYDFSSTATALADSIRWEFGNGAISGAAAPNYTYGIPGTYNVLLILQNECGTDTATLQINAGCSSQPATATTIASPTTICAGQPTTLTLTGLDPALLTSYSYQWQSSPDGITFSNIAGATSLNQPAQPAATTYYRAIVGCAASGLNSTSSNEMVTVIALPVSGTISATLNTTGDYTFTTNGNSGVSSYNWNFGDGSTSSQSSPTHTFADGTYTITLIVTNSCGSDTSTMVLGVTTSVNENNGNTFNLFPNPTSDVVTIIGENLNNSQVEIFEATGGRLVYAGTLNGNTLDVSDLLPGVYMVRLTSDGNAMQQKLVVSK